MRIMSLDLEFNQPSKKCIEIGAAIFEVRSGKKIAEFKTFVNPYEPISPDITELTTITNKDVENAPSVQQAYADLRAFHEQYKPFMNPLVWGSGTRNDSLSLYEEATPPELRENNPNFMGFRVLDVKVIHQSISMFKNITVRGGLAKTCEKLGIPFEGRAHTALADAIMTFKVWHYYMREFNYEKPKKLGPIQGE